MPHPFRLESLLVMRRVRGDRLVLLGESDEAFLREDELQHQERQRSAREVKKAEGMERERVRRTSKPLMTPVDSSCCASKFALSWERGCISSLSCRSRSWFSAS
jgi:hypothetical protein